MLSHYKNFWPHYNPMGSFWSPLVLNDTSVASAFPISGHVEESETARKLQLYDDFLLQNICIDTFIYLFKKQAGEMV